MLILPTHKQYSFTEAELLKSKMFSPETMAFIEHTISVLGEQLADFRFIGNTPEERVSATLEHAHLQGQRDAFKQLMEDCIDAYQRTAAS